MISKELLKKLRNEVLPRLGKRPRAVLEKLLDDGEVSTYTLGQLGYDQPPRAAQDLKEAGVRLITVFGKHPETGSRMGIYKLDPDQSVHYQEGRTAFPKSFVAEVHRRYGYKCNISGASIKSNELQVDHRIPFIVKSDDRELNIEDFQSLSPSSQRSKSWACEHCTNYEKKDGEFCLECYWAFPEKYSHIAGKQERRLDLVFENEEVRVYEKINRAAIKAGMSLADYVKNILRKNEKY